MRDATLEFRLSVYNAKPADEGLYTCTTPKNMVIEYNNDHGGCQVSFSLSFEHLGSFGQQSQGFSSHPRLFRALFTLKVLQSLLAPS